MGWYGSLMKAIGIQLTIATKSRQRIETRANQPWMNSIWSPCRRMFLKKSRAQHHLHLTLKSYDPRPFCYLLARRQQRKQRAKQQAKCGTCWLKMCYKRCKGTAKHGEKSAICNLRWSCHRGACVDETSDWYRCSRETALTPDRKIKIRKYRKKDKPSYFVLWSFLNLAHSRFPIHVL